MRKLIFAAALVAAAVSPAAALAHVTVQPNTAAAGAFARLDVRVPNERDDAATEKVEVQFPDGFPSASYEPVPGWSVEVKTRQFETPIQTDDGEITEGIDTITWTADSEDDAIPAGAFKDFGLSVRIPGEAGDKLTFRALQTYTGGEIVRWIGEEGSDNPAAVVTVTEPVTDPASHGGAAPGGDAEASPTPAVTTAPAASEDDGAGNGLAIVALIVGALGLVAGVAGLLSARRSGAAA